MSKPFENLVELLERSIEQYSKRELFGQKLGGSWSWMSYADFGREVDACRGGLASLGVGEDDKVAIIADNRVEWAAACYATFGLGAAYVPMYESQLAKEWRFILADCDAKVVIVATPAIAAELESSRREMASLQHIVVLDVAECDVASSIPYAAMRERGLASPVPSRRPPAESLAGLIYTSGTTGLPKGVQLTHANITSNINAVHEIFSFQPNDRSLAFLPWAHSFGQVCELHGLLSMGCSIGINDEIPKLVENLAVVKPTILFAVPRIFNRIYEGVRMQIAERPGIVQKLVQTGLDAARRRSAGESLGVLDSIALTLSDRLVFTRVRERFGGRLKYAISGSAALAREVADFIDALGIMVYEGYGLTETSPIVSANFPGHRKMGSVGRVIPGVTVKIDTSAAHGSGDGHGEEGEIVVYGPNVMQGYHNRPDENAAVRTEDGGFRTGDLGCLDKDGYVYITGRIKEQYKLENGKYVVPAPIEEKIKLSPYIANVLVFGDNKPHNVALVVPDWASLEHWAEREGEKIDRGAEPGDQERLRALMRAEIDAQCKELKGYERIKDFVVVDEDFTTENGMLTPTLKLKRRVVLQHYGDRIQDLY